MVKMLKVHDNVYGDLTELKRENETYSEVIVRLITIFHAVQKAVKQSPEPLTAKSGGVSDEA